MSINMMDIKEKLEEAYNDEDWNIIVELIETLSYEIDNGDNPFVEYIKDEDLEDENLWG